MLVLDCLKVLKCYKINEYKRENFHAYPVGLLPAQ